MKKAVDIIITVCKSNGAADAEHLSFTLTDKQIFVAGQGYFSFKLEALRAADRLGHVNFWDGSNSAKHYSSLEEGAVKLGLAESDIQSRTSLLREIYEIADALSILDDANHVLAVEVFDLERRSLPKSIYVINKPDDVLTQYAASQVMLAPKSHLVIIGRNYEPDLSNPLMVVGDLLEPKGGWGAHQSLEPSDTHYFNSFDHALQRIYPGIK